MGEIFFFPLLIPQQETKGYARDQTPSMAPVIDSTYHQTKDKDPYCPDADLSENDLTIGSSPAFTEVEDRTHEAAYGGRGTDGKLYTGQVGDQKTDNTAKGIDDEHPVHAVFFDDEVAQISQRKHIEQDVEDAPVEIIGGDEGPPTIKLGNGIGPRCSQEQEASRARRKQRKGVGGEGDSPDIEEEREYIKADIRVHDKRNDLLTITESLRQGVILPPWSWMADATVGAA